MDEKAALRVAIARDALAQLEAGAYTAKHLEYCEVPGIIPPGKDHEEAGVPDGGCTVCALGSLFVSMAHNRQRSGRRVVVSWRTRTGTTKRLDHTDIYMGLAGAFTVAELRLIEDAFESADPEWVPRSAIGNYYAARAYALRFPYSKPEMLVRAIMENIIRNGGTFDPEDLRDGLPQELPAMQQAAVVGADEQPAAPRALVLAR